MQMEMCLNYFSKILSMLLDTQFKQENIKHCLRLYMSYFASEVNAQLIMFTEKVSPRETEWGCLRLQNN